MGTMVDDKVESLPYQAGRLRHRRWVNALTRGAIMACLLAGIVFIWINRGNITSRAGRSYWAWQCRNFDVPKGHQASRIAMPGDDSQFEAEAVKVVLQPGSERVWRYLPRAYWELQGAAVLSATPAFVPSPFLAPNGLRFMAGRTTPAGEDRIVMIFGDEFNLLNPEGSLQSAIAHDPGWRGQNIPALKHSKWTACVGWVDGRITDVRRDSADTSSVILEFNILADHKVVGSGVLHGSIQNDDTILWQMDNASQIRQITESLRDQSESVLLPTDDN